MCRGIYYVSMILIVYLAPLELLTFGSMTIPGTQTRPSKVVVSLGHCWRKSLVEQVEPQMVILLRYPFPCLSPSATSLLFSSPLPLPILLLRTVSFVLTSSFNPIWKLFRLQNCRHLAPHIWLWYSEDLGLIKARS